MRLDVQISGVSLFTQNLHYILGDTIISDVLDDVTASLLGRTRQRFLTKVDPETIPWKPSQAGKLREAAGGPGTLFDTGLLFHSIQAVALAPDTRAISTDVPYGIFHQLGTRWLPVRQFLGVSDDDALVAELLVKSRIERSLLSPDKWIPT